MGKQAQRHRREAAAAIEEAARARGAANHAELTDHLRRYVTATDVAEVVGDPTKPAPEKR